MPLASRQQIYERTDADLARRVQGEILVLPDACVVLASAAQPMDDRSAASLGSEGLVAVPHPVDLVVLLSQTCDLQKTNPDSYLCQVAAVREGVEEAFAHQVARGRRPRWVALPWHDLRSVGDLSRITTVERSVLIGVESRGRPSTPTEQLKFAESVSRHFTRTAVPDKVSRVLQPLTERLRERHDRRSPEGLCIAKVASVRLEAVPRWDADSPDLTVLLILEEEDLPALPQDVSVADDEIDCLVAAGSDAAARAALGSGDARAIRQAWLALAECWAQPAVAAAAVPGSGIGGVDVEVLNGEEFSFARSRNAPELDLAYLTTRAA